MVLHRELLARLREPRDLGLGSLQFVVAFAALDPRLGRRQRRERAVLGDLLIRMILDRSTC
jgi:hypothetical protein